MSKELSPKYNPAEVEAGRYQKWLDEDVFKPSGDKKAKPYSIVIPPPNVTGKLHLGHAWDTTLQDIIIRQKRMQGFDTLWLPGMDHAGIATQAKVEERLRGEGITRYDLGREKFLDKVWEWKDELYGNKYTYLFLKQMILSQKIKYAYGYKFNGERMKRQKIMLKISQYRLKI